MSSIWALTVDWIKFEVWIGFAVISGVTAIIVVPVLVVENVRLTGKPDNEKLRINAYISGLVFIGLAVVAALVGWFAGASARKFMEIVMSNPMSP